METKTKTEVGAQGATASKANGVKNLANFKREEGKKVDEKPEAKQEPKQEPKPEPKILSIDEKVAKVQSLAESIELRAAINRHIERVAKIKSGEFSEKETITITDSRGESYVIKSSLLLQKTQVVILDALHAERAKVEEQINF